MLDSVGNQAAQVRVAHRYLAFPAIASLDNGDLLLAFRSARNCYRDFPEALNGGLHHPHTDYCSEPWLARSTDGGVMWDLEDPPRSRDALDADHAQGIGYQDVGLTKLPDGRVMLSVFRWKYDHDRPPDDLATAVRVDGGNGSRAPTDTYDYSRYEPFRYAYILEPVYTIADADGRNWTPFRTIDVAEPTAGRRWGLASRNGGVLLDEDTVGWPFYCEPTPEAPASGGCHLLRYHITQDRWSYGSQMAAGSVALPMEEQLVHRAPDGRLIAFYRCTAVGYMFTNFSLDNGRTWSAATRTRLWGYPFAALTIAGDVLLAYGYRRDPMGLRMCWLPGGEVGAFEPGREIIVRDDALDHDIGYPSMCRTDDGTIVLTYYFRSQTDTDTPTRYIEIERISPDSLR